MTTVIKKDGAKEPFNPQKIAIAANKAAVRCDITLTNKDLANIIKTVETKIKGLDEVPVSLLHELTIASLSANGFKDVSASYAEYRYYKTQYAKTFEKLHQDADDVLRLGDRENANFDSALVSTKGSLIKGYLTKSLYKQFYMSKQEKFLIDRGDIYAHDLRDMILGCVNCCLFDIGEVLRGGFEMSNVQYTEPKTVLSALQVIGDITLVATAQQFGGFTLPELDKVLLPYVKKSYNSAYYRYHNELGLEKEKAERQARLDTIREIEQGFQSLELKLNTVPCSRGDFAFTTVSFGQWDYKNISKDDAFWLMTIGKVILKTRREGHGKNHRPVVFPKLSFLYDKNQIDADIYSKELFDEAVKTSAQCMYPDYLSLSSKYGAVSQLFQKTGAVTSGMGCRAYLTPWANEKGQYITTGRCNIGAVSLNLPLILRIVQYQHPDDWKEAFWPELNERLEAIREFLKKR